MTRVQPVTEFDTCSLCPRLCRSACPVATGSGRELAVPAQLAAVLRDWRRGTVRCVDAARAAALCTDCGACRDLCHIHQPLPDLLRAARAELAEHLPRPPCEPLSPIEGDGQAVAVEADPRPLAALLARRSGRALRRWATTDRLGAAAIETAAWPEQAARLRAAAGASELVIVDGGVAAALSAAGVAFVWAWDWLGEPSPAIGSCACGGDRPLACCGGAGPLPLSHPDDALRVARLFAARGGEGELADARCRAHLRRAGLAATDWLDRMEELWTTAGA